MPEINEEHFFYQILQSTWVHHTLKKIFTDHFSPIYIIPIFSQKNFQEKVGIVAFFGQDLCFFLPF